MMASLGAVFGFLLIFIFSTSTAAPCSESPGVRCSVCPIWESVQIGDSLCGDMPKNPTTGEGSCSSTDANEHVCVEEKIFDPRRLACASIYVHNKSDTCEMVARKTDIDVRHLREINPDDVCRTLSNRPYVCVRGIFDCPQTAIPKKDQTCKQFLEDVSITQEMFNILNPGITCETSHFLTDSQHRMEEYPFCIKDPCRERHVISEVSETCEQIMQNHTMTKAHLYRNNPQLVCEDLEVGDSEVSAWLPSVSFSQICIRKIDDPLLPVMKEACGMSKNVSGFSCEQLATQYSSSFYDFMEKNPFLRCDNLTEDMPICIGYSYFPENQCTDHLAINEKQCEPLIETFFGGDPNAFYEMNPKARCATPLEQGHLICLRNSAIANLSDVTRPLLPFSRPLQIALEDYSTNQTTGNDEILLTTLLNELNNRYISVRLRHFYSKQSEVKTGVDAITGHLDREKACTQFKASYVYKTIGHITACICDQDDNMPLLTCASQLFSEFERLRGEFTYQTKDEPFMTTLACVLSVNNVDTKKGGCAYPGCKVDYLLFSVHLNTKMCRPETAPGTVPCATPEDCERNGTSVELQICSKHLILQYAFGGDPCITITGDYHVSLGVLRLNTVIFKTFLKIEVRLSFKVHEMVDDTYCDAPAFRCQDYCVWRNHQPWKMFGMLAVSLDFGSRKLPIFSETYPFPYDECYANKAVVIVENKRTKDGNITMQCWSNENDDHFIAGEVAIKYEKKYQFAFKVNYDTVVTCVLGDNNGSVAIDVYGGYNGPAGRNFHNFRVKSNEVTYYFEDQDDESSTKVVALWD